MSNVSRTVGINPPRSLGISVVSQTLQVSWLAPFEYSGAVSYSVYVDGVLKSTQAGLGFTSIALANGNHSVDVYATDSRGFMSVALSGSASVVTVTSKRWNPGWYLGARDEALRGDTFRRSLRESTWQVLQGNPNLAGGVIVFTWGSVEIAEGVYDFSEMDIDIARIKGMGKRYCLLLNAAKFDLPPPGSSDTRYCPQYLFDQGYFVYSDVSFQGHGLQYINLDVPYVADRYKKLLQALNAHLGDDPAYELYNHPETANYSCATLQTMVEDMGAIFTKANVAIENNYFLTLTPNELANLLEANRVGCGAPDLIGPPGFNWQDQGSRALQGSFGVSYLYDPGDGGSLDCGTTDHRGKQPVVYEYQKLGLVPFGSVFNYARNTVRNTHMIFFHTEGEAAGTNYSDGLLPAMASVSNQLHPLAIIRPPSYG
jgi:hypothetical protein